ncbi:Hemicentin-2 [Stylophora pistillata]|uniref:Hemicentin-2 n=1 Tax=Stylophora pistillata TaxID=50429 RepID=A0A2B4RIN7_STYPI|nr:Hemicentin-2 [Stylophora pistillata]
MDWKRCVIFQKTTGESLQCPANSKRKDAGAGCVSFIRNTQEFKKLGINVISCEFPVDENEALEQTLLSRMVQEFEGGNSSTEEILTHHEQRPAVQNAFSKDVLNAVSSYEELRNPFFEEGENLMANHTKDTMDDAVVRTVRNAREIGEEQFNLFMKERFIDRSKPATYPLKKNNLPTLRTRRSFRKKKAKVELGQVRRGKKADLLKCFPSTSAHIAPQPVVDAVIIDGAVIVQMLRPKTVRTFDEYFSTVFAPYILRHLEAAKRVWDVYQDDSLKRSLPEKSGSGKLCKVMAPTKILADWKGYLRVNHNKDELFKLLANKCFQVHQTGDCSNKTTSDYPAGQPSHMQRTLVTNSSDVEVKHHVEEGASALRVPGKILEDVVSSSLDHHIESQGLLSNNQWGFRKNYSTEGILLYLTETWKEALDTGLKVGVLFIDFRKAFDSVNHLILQKKLQAMDVSGDFLSWFTSYLCERRQFVQLSGIKSGPRLIKYDVLQGSILGPRLFSIFAKHFPEAVTDGELFMFADDTTIFTIVSPQITESPINQTVTEGYSVNFSCRASGIPTPTLAWVFNNSDLPSGSNKTDQEVESILELTRVTKEMKGTYKCTATNKESSTSSSATLIVYGKASAQVVSESHQTLTTGDVFALTCKVNEETINIAWKKDGESLKERAVIDTRLHARKSKLVITEVVEEDSGEYSCEASNKAGTVAHSSVILDVEAAPSSSPLEWYYIVGPVAAVIFLFALIVHTEKCRAAALQEDAGPDERGAAAAIPNSEGGEPGATVYPFVTEANRPDASQFPPVIGEDVDSFKYPPLIEEEAHIDYVFTLDVEEGITSKPVTDANDEGATAVQSVKEDQGDAVDLCDEAVNVQGHNGYQLAAVDTEEIENYEDEQPSEATPLVQD